MKSQWAPRQSSVLPAVWHWPDCPALYRRLRQLIFVKCKCSRWGFLWSATLVSPGRSCWFIWTRCDGCVGLNTWPVLWNRLSRINILHAETRDAAMKSRRLWHIFVAPVLYRVVYKHGGSRWAEAERLTTPLRSHWRRFVFILEKCGSCECPPVSRSASLCFLSVSLPMTSAWCVLKHYPQMFLFWKQTSKDDTCSAVNS